KLESLPKIASTNLSEIIPRRAAVLK
ncbi:hypothetical protein, partial [Escherichia coli]